MGLKERAAQLKIIAGVAITEPSAIIEAAISVTKTSIGIDLSSPEEIKSRLAICGGCKYAVKDKKGEVKSCGKCGCITKLKIRDTKQKCPIGLWGPQQEKEN